MVKIRFGIPELDRMLDLYFEEGKTPEDAEDVATSLTILGPDGTGKSIMALHLAAQYFADSHKNNSQNKVIYVSTDLKYESALSVWKKFRLFCPNERDIPLERATERRERRGAGKINVDLVRLSPACESTEEFLRPEVTSGVGFLDFASTSAGDDWRYTNRLLSLLEEEVPENRGPKHLVIIDSVAGFETLVGERDAFGEPSSRRARIAQVMRAARQHCHVLFVVEEPQEGLRLPEEFVADTVIRLRRDLVKDAMRRTLEIEKARARSHATGLHPFEIRDERGLSTGAWQDADSPVAGNSYVQVFYSLHHINRLEARASRSEPGRHPPRKASPAPGVAGFGIPYLDNMLAHKDGHWGLPAGTLTSLIGNSGTGKSVLAYSFLCESFKEYSENLPHLIEAIEKKNVEAIDDLLSKLRAWGDQTNEAIDVPNPAEPDWIGKLVAACKKRDRKSMECFESKLTKDENQVWLDSENRKPPLKRVQYPWAWHRHNPQGPLEVADWILRHPAYVTPAILIATDDVNSAKLAPTFANWLGAKEWPRERLLKLQHYIEQHLICRRLGVRDTTTPSLFHVVSRSVREAQRLVFGPALPHPADERMLASHRIRIALDDFRTLLDMYTDVRHDALFLPALVFFLGREGLTGLIVDTDSGRPDTEPTDPMNRELRALVSQHLYAWQVPFYGETRVAIAVIPPLSSQHAGIVREVKWIYELPSEAGTAKRPTVDPHFELYSGLEQGQPQRVPLDIRLYAETPAFTDYIQQENGLLREVFAPRTPTDDPSQAQIIQGLPTRSYGALRDFCHLPTDLRLDHTLIFQVDGFWALRRAGSLINQHRYLSEPTRCDGEPDANVDPFQLFQPTVEPPKRNCRIDYFHNEPIPGKEYVTRIGIDDDEEDSKRMDRIPFSWDFTFLLCKDVHWTSAAEIFLANLAKKIEMELAADGFSQNEADAAGCGLLFEQLIKELQNRINVKLVWDSLPRFGIERAHRGFDLQTLPQFGELSAKLNLPPKKVRCDTWRAFLEATRAVAEHVSGRVGHPVLPFDVSVISGDSVSCLILEIWFSEILAAKRRAPAADEILQRISRQKFVRPEEGLIDLLAEDAPLQEIYGKFKKEYQKNKSLPLKSHSLELYKTWMLLTEVLDFSSFADPNNPFEFQIDRMPSPDAVSTHHWYKTACMSSIAAEKTGHASEIQTAVRLPGNFSVRGDWYLAAAIGSRSGRLADRALDLLSSRRANIRRMQMGMGLPTRDVIGSKEVGNMRTALRAPDQYRLVNNVRYGDLCKLAARSSDNPSEGDQDDYFWLWRSGLRDYDRHSRAWQRWLNRLFRWTHQYKDRFRHSWRGGFVPYDEIERGDFSNVVQFDSFVEFAETCDLLLAELQASAQS